MKISQLESATDLSEVSFVGARPGSNVKIDMNTLVSQMWDKMYVHAQNVIITCGYCAAHNAITNPVCVACGAPMGKVE